MEPILSLSQAAVEAGLGTLGLNLQLLTPEYGPRVILAAVLCSVEVECDKPMSEALCKGPSCGRCLKTCPGDAVQEWGRDWNACDKHRSPHGFAQLTEHLDRIIKEGDAKKRKDLLRSEDSFNLWQSILRGAGVVTGCRRCADVCPVGADYAMLADALEQIPENTPAKEKRLAAMKGDVPAAQKRFIGFLKVV
jgi:epoxyqueuosine reductase QueG